MNLKFKKMNYLKKIQNSWWEDDRSFEPIPEKKEIISYSLRGIDLLEDKEITIPEHRPLPSEVGRIYRKWYGAVRVIIERNQPVRLDEFNKIYNYYDMRRTGVEPANTFVTGS
jgi:hypothetical protein